MADNSVLPGTGDTYASDDIGGVKFPRVKLIYGGDGTNSGDVEPSNPFPVQVPSGISLNAPSGIVANMPSGVLARNPSGYQLVGSGAPISHQNPLAVSVPSGVVVTMPSGLSQPVIATYSGFFGTVALPSGANMLAPSGLRTIAYGSGAPIAHSNPFPVAVQASGGVPIAAPSGIQVFAPSGLAVTGNLSASIGTGVAVGLVASGLPVSNSNPLPVSVVTGGDGSVQGVTAHGSIATGVQDPLGIGGFAYASAPPSVDDGDAVNGWFTPQGAQVTSLNAAGTLILAGMGAASAGLRTAPATDGIWPVSQATGGQFLVTARQATGTVQLVGQPTGQIFPVVARSTEAHGFNPTGSPFLMGMQGRGADPIAVASGAVAQAYGDTLGKQIVMPGAPHSQLRSGYIGVNGTGSRNVLAAPGSGFALVVTSIKAVNSSPTYASEVVLHDGVATLSGGLCAAQGGGFAEEGGMFPLFVASSNQAIQAVNLATGADIKVRVSAYRISNP